MYNLFGADGVAASSENHEAFGGAGPPANANGGAGPPVAVIGGKAHSIARSNDVIAAAKAVAMAAIPPKAVAMDLRVLQPKASVLAPGLQAPSSSSSDKINLPPLHGFNIVPNIQDPPPAQPARASAPRKAASKAANKAAARRTPKAARKAPPPKGQAPAPHIIPQAPHGAFFPPLVKAIVVMPKLAGQLQPPGAVVPQNAAQLPLPAAAAVLPKNAALLPPPAVNVIMPKQPPAAVLPKPAAPPAVAVVLPKPAAPPAAAIVVPKPAAPPAVAIVVPKPAAPPAVAIVVPKPAAPPAAAPLVPAAAVVPPGPLANLVVPAELHEHAPVAPHVAPGGLLAQVNPPMQGKCLSEY